MERLRKLPVEVETDDDSDFDNEGNGPEDVLDSSDHEKTIKERIAFQNRNFSKPTQERRLEDNKRQIGTQPIITPTSFSGKTIKASSAFTFSLFLRTWNHLSTSIFPEDLFLLFLQTPTPLPLRKKENFQEEPVGEKRKEEKIFLPRRPFLGHHLRKTEPGGCFYAVVPASGMDSVNGLTSSPW
ncbi:hypothetical protein AVEN_37261-1 [Araneus ventricosus]|uniref:Uncharacterized protein n=1 Tax=Araneus ventricosus TaxID=182803 RepID=A0A4Y2KKR4_ARAVE|nr:hypothetical protein AVEN_37261-1 [Araneus ventricosus]